MDENIENFKENLSEKFNKKKQDPQNLQLHPNCTKILTKVLNFHVYIKCLM